MIDISGKSGFFAATLFKFSFSRFCALCLQPLTQSEITPTNIFDLRSGIKFAVGSRSNFGNAQIDAQKSFAYVFGFVDTFGNEEQIKFAVDISQVGLSENSQRVVDSDGGVLVSFSAMLTNNR